MTLTSPNVVYTRSFLFLDFSSAAARQRSEENSVAVPHKDNKEVQQILPSPHILFKVETRSWVSIPPLHCFRPRQQPTVARGEVFVTVTCKSYGKVSACKSFKQRPAHACNSTLLQFPARDWSTIDQQAEMTG